MPRKTSEHIQTRVDLNAFRVNNLENEEDLAHTVFPNRNAKKLRAAFILIFLGLKYDPDGSLAASEMDDLRREKAPQISKKTLWKARATMSRLGFIYLQHRARWRFSEKFARSCQKLADITLRRMTPRPDPHQRRTDWNQLDTALAHADAEE